MKKLVVLKLNGDFNQGFQVNLNINIDHDSKLETIAQGEGHLPANIELEKHYQNWQKSYHSLDGKNRIKAKPAQVTNVNLEQLKQECETNAEELRDRLQDWLQASEFRPLKEKCLKQLNSEDQIRVIIQTNSQVLQGLPWRDWDLLEDYHVPTVGFSLIESKLAEPQEKKLDAIYQVRILAILGHSGDINTNQDYQELQKIPGAKITLLVEPKRQEINDKLWSQSWDLLFFAGHSETEEGQGKIYINPQESLTIEQLKYALKTAIKNGLKLAIFNSCDGLGLAWNLQELNLPHIIVMREPIPDKIAHEFLKHFLSEFAQNKSLYEAVGIASQRLQGRENEYPCASWLPIIIQNPTIPTPTWHSLRYGNQKQISKRILGTALVASGVVTGLVIVVRSLGILQGWELQTYDRFMQLRPAEPVDERIVVIEVTESDLSYQKDQGMEQQGSSLADKALALLLQKLAPHQPRVMGLDIFHDYPFSAPVQSQLDNYPNFFAVCEGYESQQKPGVSPPPGLAPDKVGFSDVVTDIDGVLRRHLWSANLGDEQCVTDISWSLQLAVAYLAGEGIEPVIIQESLQLGKVTLQPLDGNTGGYQGIDTRGYQMLLNYRSPQIAQTVTLRDVLEGEIDLSIFNDKLVIIGTTAHTYKDFQITPLSRSKQQHQKMPGVMIQAQMASQIISAVLDNRPLLGVWGRWQEALWVLGWATTGGLLAWRIRHPSVFIALGVVVVGLTGVCYWVFLQGIWILLIPPILALFFTGGVVYFVFRLT